MNEDRASIRGRIKGDTPESMSADIYVFEHAEGKSCDMSSDPLWDLPNESEGKGRRNRLMMGEGRKYGMGIRLSSV